MFDITGKYILGAGALLDGVSSGAEYYNEHQDQGVTGAVIAGCAHAAITTAGTYAGGEIGTFAGAALGTLIFPGLGTVVGGVIGSFVDTRNSQCHDILAQKIRRCLIRT